MSAILIRKRVQPHGKQEVLVTFEVDGELRNHLLRITEDDDTASVLNARYRDNEEERQSKITEINAAHDIVRESIDEDAFNAAEAEILAALKAAKE